MTSSIAVANPLLTVNGQSISVDRAFAYLQSSGRFESVIGQILRQHILESELQMRQLEASEMAIEQAVIGFRMEQHLEEPQRYQQWLAQNNMTETSLRSQFAIGIQMQQLIEQITEPRLQETFIERKLMLDRVVLSRIIVDDLDVAQELLSQIEEGVAFEQLAQDYSLTDDRIVNGMMGVLNRGQLPDVVRSKIDSAAQKDVVGPVPLGDRWGLFRVEQLLPASLGDEAVQQTLRQEIFEEWIVEKIRTATVSVALSA